MAESFASLGGRWAAMACGVLHAGLVNASEAGLLGNASTHVPAPSCEAAATPTQLVLTANHLYTYRLCGNHATLSSVDLAAPAASAVEQATSNATTSLGSCLSCMSAHADLVAATTYDDCSLGGEVALFGGGASAAQS